MLLNKIKEKLNGKSIKKLGEEVGLSYPAIHNICNITDLSTIQIGNVVAIARELNVEVTELYREILFDVNVYCSWTDNSKYKEEADARWVFTGNKIEECRKYIVDEFDANDYARVAHKYKNFEAHYEITPMEIDKWGGTKDCFDIPSSLGVYEDYIVFSVSDILDMENKRDALDDLFEHLDYVLSRSNAINVIKEDINYWTTNYFELAGDAEVKAIEIENLNDGEIVSEFKKQLQKVGKELKEVKDALKILNQGE